MSGRAPVESLRKNPAYADYDDIGSQHRDYSASGTDIVNFAYQQRDSIVTIYSYLQKINSIP